MSPQVSVLITIDYAAATEATWSRLREVLCALAAQDDGETEFLLVESSALRERVPADLPRRLPGLRILFAESDDARVLKSAGLQAARTDLVAMLDGDCVPQPGWLAECREAARLHPAAAVISGVTRYDGGSLLTRVLEINSRSFIDDRRDDDSRHLTENNAVCRRREFLRVLDGDAETAGVGAHSSSLRGATAKRLGMKMAVDPHLVVNHAHDWSSEVQIRRSLGFGIVRARQVDRAVPYSWTVRIGPLSLPAVFAGRLLNSWRMCVANGRRYGLRAYQQPAALAITAVCCLMEIPGAARALRGLDPPQTAFR